MVAGNHHCLRQWQQAWDGVGAAAGVARSRAATRIVGRYSTAFVMLCMACFAQQAAALRLHSLRSAGGLPRLLVAALGLPPL